MDMDMMQPPSSSSSSSTSYRFIYDVFLSFRGIDTRYCFGGNLHKALCDRGIRAFFDDKELQRGDKITPSLVKAIGESRIFIPVLSINYASSSFCLDELVWIMDCFTSKGCLVLPVFHGVEPSEVRHQTGVYGKDIANHEKRFQNNKEKYKENMERLLNWKVALTQTANLAGYHFDLGMKEYEYEVIGKIVDEVSKKINRASLYVVDYPVGLKSRLLKVNSLLAVESDDGVRMVGVHGIGGMGKSTLAREIYNFIADQFESLCFLHNVRENSAKHGLENLQERLLFKTIGENIKLGDTNEGIPIIKHRLQQKKVLLILDDVHELKQLQVLAGGLDWFGPGSRVIITTRNKQLLTSHGIERAYEIDKLNGEESFELLRWKALKHKMVEPCYEHILKCAVTYASGLPLALEVVGSNLFGQRVEEWKYTLNQYKRTNTEIHKILKVSFDYLEEDEKSIFLDISCCFKGYPVEEVEDILFAHHGECMKYAMRVLVEKSLIKISPRQDVTFHDLIENMGKVIVREESPKELGKRSRLWFHKDVVEVLEENLGTSQIETMYLDIPLSEEVVEWKGDEFKKIENLKTLIIKNGLFSKGPKHLPNSLRVLEWPRYPSQHIPSDFRPRKLSICRLPESDLTIFELHSSLKSFITLRELNLNNSQCLRQILNVSGLQNLEKFSFRCCRNLIQIHDSIGLLSKLKILDAEGCSKLKSFPPLKLTSLEQLKLSFCESLKWFPEILGQMKNIRVIVLKGTSIEEFPFSFRNLTGLHTLGIWGSGSGMLRLPGSLFMMPNLSEVYVQGCQLLPIQNDELNSTVFSNVQKLRLIKCNLPDELLSTLLMWFANVKYLNLLGSHFTILPECLKDCHYLSSLNMNCCKYLQEIQGIPPSLKHVSALRCESLTSSSRSMLLNQELHEARSTDFCMAGTARIPEWFEHQSKGSSISFWFRNKIPSISLFVVSKSMADKSLQRPFYSLRVVMFVNCDVYFIDERNGVYRIIEQDHTYLYDLHLPDRGLEKSLSKNEWNHAVVAYVNSMMIPILTESAIHVFKHEGCTEDVQFTNPSL